MDSSPPAERLPDYTEGKCLHCGRDALNGPFCCGGCRLIYDTIHRLGLTDFYRYREASESQRFEPLQELGSTYGSYDDETFHSTHIFPLADGLVQARLHLTGIHCAGCIWLVEKLPELIEGVREARLSFAHGNVTLTFDPTTTRLSTIAQFLHSLGYPSCPLEEESISRAEAADDRLLLLRLGVAGFCASNTMLLAVSLFQGWFTGMEEQYADYFRWTSLLLALPAITFSAAPFYRAAFGSLAARKFHIDLPIAIALLASFALSTYNTFTGRSDVYFDSAAALIFLLLSSRFVQRRAVRVAAERSRVAWSVMPTFGRRVVGENRESVALSSLRAGDVVEVLPGERFPSDGHIQTGYSRVDRSVLTGESQPEQVGPSDLVHGGTLNIQSALLVKLSTSFSASRVGRLLQEIAEGRRAPSSFLSFTERASKLFVSTVLVLALLTLVLRWGDGLYPALEATLALLIVTCPCALALASPLLAARAVSSAARIGLLMKNVDALEGLLHSRNVYFDKTGTLTDEAVTVHDCALEAGAENDIFSAIPLLCSATPHHPVSRALLEYAYDRTQSPAAFAEPRVEAIPGKGLVLVREGIEWRVGSLRFAEENGTRFSPGMTRFIEAAANSGDSVAVLSKERSAVAVFSLRERLKPSAISCVEALARAGKTITILSGDKAAVVRKTGYLLQLPTERCLGDLSPEGKRDIVASSRGGSIMIGDGFNDGGAMQAADVAVAVRGGTQPNLEVADLIVTAGDLSTVIRAFQGARRLQSTLWLILGVSSLYNLCGAALAMSGRMSPLVAALIMPLSSITVITLALVCDPFKPMRKR